jgi:hypothetical protein
MDKRILESVIHKFDGGPSASILSPSPSVKTPPPSKRSTNLISS